MPFSSPLFYGTSHAWCLLGFLAKVVNLVENKASNMRSILDHLVLIVTLPDGHSHSHIWLSQSDSCYSCMECADGFWHLDIA